MIVSLELTPESKLAIQRAADRAEDFRPAVAKAVHAAVVGGADRIVVELLRGRYGLTMRHPGQGGLAGSVFGWMLSDDPPVGAVGVPSNTPAARYAGMLERGGMIRPRTARMLAIPLSGEAKRMTSPRQMEGLFLLRSRAGNLLLARRSERGGGRLDLHWVLKDQVRIEPRHWLSRGAEDAADEMAETFADVLGEELKGE